MKIMVAMSGGVDSSAAAALLLKRGFEVCGVTFLLCESAALSTEEASASSAAVRDSKDICRQLGIPHLVADFRNIFEEKVRRPFVEGYLAGITPNPCVNCNKHIKFPAFFEFARQHGCDRIATGHYACVVCGKDGIHRIKKAHSIEKDQSYMLYNLTEELLKHIELPLGEFSKDEIRKFAADVGLSVSSKPDSQDICFIPDKDTPSYLSAQLEQMGVSLPVGNFIDQNGKILGAHKGIWNYTLGQHKRLGIALGSSRYVSAIDPTENTVTLVEDEQLIFSQS
ncbi:MAG: tRNA 2-thiouridine(34) synthase MnmA, partial [Oscillospiraceae bacterium]|nr:tRNA 2-thiouridine(34) synthase MnmA [Oscillospiraceae bacterium]